MLQMLQPIHGPLEGPARSITHGLIVHQQYKNHIDFAGRFRYFRTAGVADGEASGLAHEQVRNLML
jgi:hypothetical protein